MAETPQCCLWHKSGGAIWAFCGDQDAQGILIGPPTVGVPLLGVDSGSAGSPAGLSPLAAAVWRARGGPPPPHLGGGASAGYTSPSFRTESSSDQPAVAGGPGAGAPGPDATGLTQQEPDPDAADCCCSFCDKARRLVRKLVARGGGPKVYICDECIGLCNGILGREQSVVVTFSLGAKKAVMVVLAPGAKEILRVPAGATPAELRAHGFPDVAAALEKAPTP